MPAPAPLRGLPAAVAFLTRLPLGRVEYRPADWRWASAWFPFVGIILGSIQAGLWLTIDTCWSPLTVAIMVVALGLLVTGAFHEDGLADTVDALGGAFDRAKLFEILKDSRIGTFGAAALTLSLLARVSLLAELHERAPLGLVLAASAARTGPIWLMAILPYVTGEGARSKPVAAAGAPQVALASVWGMAPWLLCLATQNLSIQEVAWTFGSLLLLTVLCAQRFRARADGLTGDFLGALEQLGEIAVLAVLAAF